MEMVLEARRHARRPEALRKACSFGTSNIATYSLATAQRSCYHHTQTIQCIRSELGYTDKGCCIASAQVLDTGTEIQIIATIAACDCMVGCEDGQCVNHRSTVKRIKEADDEGRGRNVDETREI